MMTSYWLPLVLWGGVGAALLMFVLWLLHLPLRNAAIVDFGWALSLGLLGMGYATFGQAWRLRAAILGIMSGFWGLRLAVHLLTDRVIGQPEEGRYQELRRRWKTNLEAKFFVFFEMQALLAVLLSVPFLIPALNASRRLSAFEWTGVAIWLMAIAGETAADAQLARFKARPENRGRTCREGLWRYSRHPNYFFEWMIWMSFAIFAMGSPFGYLGLISPALILYFLLRVTGIPATEEQALRSRGDDYRRYQETTSAFVPWFPKSTSKQANPATTL